MNDPRVEQAKSFDKSGHILLLISPIAFGVGNAAIAALAGSLPVRLVAAFAAAAALQALAVTFYVRAARIRAAIRHEHTRFIENFYA